MSTPPSTLPPSMPRCGESVSQRVADRMRAARIRFHANDNIAPWLEEGELAAIEQEVAGKAQALLRALVIDVEHDHNSHDTACRLARMFVREVFAGRYQREPAVTDFPNVERLNELMVVGPLRVRSACSHHLCPIMGRVWIGVLPRADSRLIGLSKYARLTDWVMRRPQIQEEAVSQLATLLEQRLQPEGLAVVMRADHFCMHWRGVQDDGAHMTSSVMRGAFLADASLRKEFLSLLHDGSA